MKDNDISTVNLNTSAAGLYNNNMKTLLIQGLKNDDNQSLVSHPVTEKHSIGSVNQVATPSVLQMMKQQRVISILLLDN
jgi:hypothetical protein